jgi:hypothetical protein
LNLTQFDSKFQIKEVFVKPKKVSKMVADGKPIPKKMENKSNQKFNKSTNENLKGVKGNSINKSLII